MSTHLIYMLGMVANLGFISFITPSGHRDERNNVIVSCELSYASMKHNEFMVSVPVIRNYQLLPVPEVMKTCQLRHVST